ncbi:MAG: hypothetical protein ACK5NB_12165 [Flavobacteriaceae bacterium]
MQYVWVDYNHAPTNSVRLNTCFAIPNTNLYRDFCLIINQDGTTQIIETTHKKTT